MGTLSRSWELLQQSFAVLKSDKELMWLPVVSAVFCVAATVIIFGGGALLVLPLRSMPHDVAAQKLLYQQMAPFVFLFYLATYSITIYFNVALVSIASNRLAGGNATLNDGLQAAWRRKWRILQWALLAATVGILLRALERRASFIGRIVIGIIGAVWSLASFFVVPLLAAEDIGPIDALYRSAKIFRETWGEEVVGGFSFGVIFFLLALPGILPPLVGARFGVSGVLAGSAVAVIYWLLLAVVSSAAQGIFVAALYRYATTHQISGGFSSDDLSRAWQPKA
jgi:xanthosine utilization system XapX-like protein